MKREHIVLRTPSINSDITKPRLLDSNGKRKSNNKIAIFSNKYNNLMSTHSLPEGSQELSTQMSKNNGNQAPLMKTNSDFASTSISDNNSQRLTYESKTITEYQPQIPRIRQQNMLILIREEINNVKNRYQAKMRQLVQSSARTICELRHMLTENQRKLAQKQLTIQKLISQIHLTNPNQKINEKKLGQKLSQSQFKYLKSRMHDIQVKVMVLVEALAKRDDQTTSKIQELQQKLIRNAGSRLIKSKLTLQFVLCELSKKIQIIEQNIKNSSAIPKTIKNENISVDCLITSVSQLEKKVLEFSNRQWKYECPNILRLKSILQDLTQKVKQKDNQNNIHLDQNYYFEDEDEFFYPSTQRVYQASDQYQHFQQDSQDEGFKKQNRSPNYRSACKRTY